MIIAISGKINSGKDTVGKIIQIFTAYPIISTPEVLKILQHYEGVEWEFSDLSDWKIKKFSDKLKDMVCILLGCTREQLENREFKEEELGEEWWYYKDSLFTERMLPYTDNKGLEDDLTYYIIKLSPRLLMQLIGTECGRNIIHPNIWVNALMNEYNCVPADRAPNGWDCPNWIITDTRFPNEVEAVKKRGGITIRVNRTFKHKLESGEEHISETLLDEYADWDYTIENNGSLEELIDKVKEILIKQKLKNE